METEHNPSGHFRSCSYCNALLPVYGDFCRARDKRVEQKKNAELDTNTKPGSDEAQKVVLTLGGCGQSSTSQDLLPHAVSPAVHHTTSPASIQTPTLDEKANPVRLLIPVIAVNALFEAVGVTPGGDLAVPTQNPWEDVGWYASGPPPDERGSAVIDGHLDRPGGYSAVF